jgi:hypothetical protein
MSRTRACPLLRRSVIKNEAPRGILKSGIIAPVKDAA